MGSSNVKKKISIYSLKTKKEILNYYKDWTTNNQYNKDMIDWKYTAHVNTVQLLDEYIHDENIKISTSLCGTIYFCIKSLTYFKIKMESSSLLALLALLPENPPMSPFNV